MGFFGSVGKFVSNAAKTAGKGVHSATHAAATATGAIGKTITKVPLVGPGLHGAFELTTGAPFKLADSIASGKRIDKVALDTLKNQVQSVKEVAPYAATVVSMVPAVGPGISGGIAASLAIAEGKTLDQIAMEAMKNAVPGGPAGKALFAATAAVLSGKSIKDVGLAALPIPDSSKKAVSIGLTVAQNLASGKAVDKTMLNAGLAALPDNAKKAVQAAVKAGKNPAAALADASLSLLPTDQAKAVQVGIAVGNAKVLQLKKATALKNPATLTALADHGKKLAQSNPVIAQAASIAKNPAGFAVGMGLMSKAGVTEKDIATVRSTLKGANVQAFDAALATHVGMVTKVAPKGLDPKQQAAYYATHGLAGASNAQVKGQLAIMANDPKLKAGAIAASKEVKDIRASWFVRLKRYLGLKA